MKGQKRFNFSSLLQFKTTLVLITLVVLFFTFAWSALALETGLEYGTYTGLATQDIRVTIMKIVRIALGLVGIIAISIIIYAGYVWMTSAGNAERIEKAKKILQSAAIGLLIIFFAFAIVSFIINMLEGAGIIPSIPPGPPPPSGCENCGHLGGGIIESVYPPPFARDVPRDTSIIVTFKEKIKPETVMAVAEGTVCNNTPTNLCAGKNLAVTSGQPNVRIFKRSQGEDEGTLAATVVNVTSIDGKTFVFKPVSPLGDSTTKYYYTTKLTNKLIRLDTNELAFPGANDYFSWDFEVGTKLDLVPPKLGDMFPVPDNIADTYEAVTGAPATGTIIIAKQPLITQEASAELSLGAGFDDSGLTVLLSGSYSGIYEGVLAISIGGAGALTVSWPGTDFIAPNDYFSNITVASETRRADFGHGISVILQDQQLGDYSGKQFTIRLKPLTNADRLQIADKVYWFVDKNNPNPAENEIKISGDPGSLGGRLSLRDAIAAKINAQIQNPNITAVAENYIVILESERAGAAGNFVNISATGNWATITPMSGGEDESTAVRCSNNGLCDQPRNVIIKMNFSEPVMPEQVSGIIQTNEDNSLSIAGAGRLKPEDFRNIVVQADLDGDGSWEDDEYISGTFIQSNQYKTVEFMSLQPCGDVPYNSCGDPLFCLPINPNLNYIKYKVTIKTALLGTECSDASQCAGLSYEDGTMTEECLPLSSSEYCGKSAVKNIYYMKSANPAGGVVDLASNSFDGNENGYVEGTQIQTGSSAYNLNNADVADGDDLTWSFNINNRIDVVPPNVLKVSPSVSGSGQSLASPISTTFNKLLQSSTVRPGWGYKDGKCTCVTSADCESDQTCKDVNGSGVSYCINENNAQVYCAKDAECSEDSKCITKRYITLYDETSRPAGWWISNNGEDTSVCLNEEYRYRECDPANAEVKCGSGGDCGLPDGYSDRTIAQIRHTPLLESTKYDAEIASGVKDIYQNCYVPGEGPAGDVNSADNRISICDPYLGGSGCCGVTAVGMPPAPYCCNGVAMSKADWGASVCGQLVKRNFKQ